MARCIGRRPNGTQCENSIPLTNRAFCVRCDGEVFFSYTRQAARRPEADKPQEEELLKEQG